MSQRNLYIVIGVLVLAVLGLGYAWYQQANQPAAISVDLPNGSISIGSDGVKVETTTPSN